MSKPIPDLMDELVQKVGELGLKMDRVENLLRGGFDGDQPGIVHVVKQHAARLEAVEKTAREFTMTKTYLTGWVAGSAVVTGAVVWMLERLSH